MRIKKKKTYRSQRHVKWRVSGIFLPFPLSLSFVVCPVSSSVVCMCASPCEPRVPVWGCMSQCQWVVVQSCGCVVDSTLKIKRWINKVTRIKWKKQLTIGPNDDTNIVWAIVVRRLVIAIVGHSVSSLSRLWVSESDVSQCNVGHICDQRYNKLYNK